MQAINGNAKSVIDLSVQERSIQDARRGFCDMLSERALIGLLNGGYGGSDEELVTRAWKLAELQYDEMIRRRALNAPVTIAERMAAQSMGHSVA